MPFRSVVEELEAKLRPVKPHAAAWAPRGLGKAEWKQYGDGSRLGSLVLTGLDLPDGSELELTSAGRPIDRLVVQQGGVRYRRESALGESVPLVERNQLMQVLYQGQVILSGLVYRD